MTGTLNATWPGDLWKTGGGATWLGGSYDAETNTLVFGAGNPAPWNSWLRNAGDTTDGNGRQPLCRLAHRPGPGHRRDQVALPDHPARRLGL